MRFYTSFGFLILLLDFFVLIGRGWGTNYTFSVIPNPHFLFIIFNICNTKLIT